MDRLQFGTDVIIKVAQKSNCSCMKCGSQDNIHIHHITPLSKGGNNSIENLILLCEFCHRIIHKNKGELYNEEQFYSGSGYQMFKEDIIFNDLDYAYMDIGWGMDIDSTDHFDFTCPKCKLNAIISKVELRSYNSLNLSPCFYFYLKCPICKIRGQRKAYVNYGIDRHIKIKESKI